MMKRAHQGACAWYEQVSVVSAEHSKSRQVRPEFHLATRQAVVEVPTIYPRKPAQLAFAGRGETFCRPKLTVLGLFQRLGWS